MQFPLLLHNPYGIGPLLPICCFISFPFSPGLFPQSYKQAVISPILNKRLSSYSRSSFSYFSLEKNCLPCAFCICCPISFCAFSPKPTPFRYSPSLCRQWPHLTICSHQCVQILPLRTEMGNLEKPNIGIPDMLWGTARP